MLGFVVAVGLPAAVLVLTILWPVCGVEEPEESENVRDSADHTGDGAVGLRASACWITRTGLRGGIVRRRKSTIA